MLLIDWMSENEVARQNRPARPSLIRIRGTFRVSESTIAAAARHCWRQKRWTVPIAWIYAAYVLINLALFSKAPLS
jgi:hypothetical protein